MATKRQIKAAVEGLSEALDIVMAAKSQTEHLSTTWQHLDTLTRESDRLRSIDSPNAMDDALWWSYQQVMRDLERRLNGDGGAKDIYNHASEVWGARRKALLALDKAN